MPLKSGSSQKVIQENIRELVNSWKKTGKIGNSRPENEEEAIRQATAIAYAKAGKSRDKKAEAAVEELLSRARALLRERGR